MYTYICVYVYIYIYILRGSQGRGFEHRSTRGFEHVNTYLRVKHDQTGYYKRPPFLGTPLVPSISNAPKGNGIGAKGS